MIDCKALEVSIDEDLRELSRYLWALGLPHRITEQSGKQIVWVGEPTQIDPLRELYARWRRGETLPPVERKSRYVFATTRRFDPRLVPLTCLLIALSVFGYLIAEFDGELKILPWLTFFEFRAEGAQISFTLPLREYWRLLTPIFLHFSLLHIVFNMLWLWDLGGRIERVQGTWRLLGLVGLIGAGSNIAQAVFADVGIFGGMSGVIYGLLGYSWAWGGLRRDPALHVPTPIVAVMVGWLLLCIVGFTELMGLGGIANAAHVGGLVLGLILGAGAALLAPRSGMEKS
ncbi:MAG: rhomboid family intramembrane serine protease [Spongiibacteraceae bacterium]